MKEEESLKDIEKKGLQKLKKEKGMQKILLKHNEKRMKNWSIRQEGQCITSLESPSSLKCEERKRFEARIGTTFELEKTFKNH